MVSEAAQVGGFGVHLLHSDFAGLAETHDSGHVQRAGTHAALVAATVDLRGDLHTRIAAANVESANALGTVELMPGDGGHIHVVGNHVERNLADDLHGIGVKDNALLVAKLADLADGLEYADFVVG